MGRFVLAAVIACSTTANAADKYRVTHYPPDKRAPAQVWETDKVPTWHFVRLPDGKWERTGYMQFFAQPGNRYILVKPDLIETIPAIRVIGRDRNTWRRRL